VVVELRVQMVQQQQQQQQRLVVVDLGAQTVQVQRRQQLPPHSGSCSCWAALLNQRSAHQRS
jgi:hypothetical protein